MKVKFIKKILNIFMHKPYKRSKKEAIKIDCIPSTEEFERCIMCGELTDISITTPIEFRDNYELGCGQLCAICYKKLGKSDPKKTLSYGQILMAVEQSRVESNKQ